MSIKKMGITYGICNQGFYFLRNGKGIVFGRWFRNLLPR